LTFAAFVRSFGHKKKLNWEVAGFGRQGAPLGRRMIFIGLPDHKDKTRTSAIFFKKHKGHTIKNRFQNSHST
jgi:hypothetical protein